MGIELIEAGCMASAVSGWIGSRTLENPPTTQELATIDASVNELPTALFYWRDMMIIERELVVTPRNHVIWARTSRVDDPTQFTVPFGFRDVQHAVIKQHMQEAKDNGVPQDEWRTLMPICATTSWTMRLSWRDAIRLACYFADVSAQLEARNIRLAARLLNTSLDLQSMLPAAFGVLPETVEKALTSFKRMKFTKLKEMPPYTKIGNMVALTARIPLVLRGQFVRHREFIFADDFIDLLNSQHSEQCNQRSMVNVQAVALESTWRTVLGKRTCWMAQSDLWQPFAQAFGSNPESLPCSGGVCPYAEDAKLRAAGKDPGAPCPRYASLTNTPLTQEQFVEAALQAERTSNPPMWRHTLEHAPLVTGETNELG